MRLKYEVDVISEAYPLAVRQRKQVVVVQDGVQGLDPLRVDITIAYQPRLYLFRGAERAGDVRCLRKRTTENLGHTDMRCTTSRVCVEDVVMKN